MGGVRAPVQPLLLLPLCRMQIIRAAGSTDTLAGQPVCLHLPGPRQREQELLANTVVLLVLCAGLIDRGCSWLQAGQHWGSAWCDSNEVVIPLLCTLCFPPLKTPNLEALLLPTTMGKEVFMAIDFHQS